MDYNLIWHCSVFGVEWTFAYTELHVDKPASYLKYELIVNSLLKRLFIPEYYL